MKLTAHIAQRCAPSACKLPPPGGRMDDLRLHLLQVCSDALISANPNICGSRRQELDPRFTVVGHWRLGKASPLHPAAVRAPAPGQARAPRQACAARGAPRPLSLRPACGQSTPVSNRYAPRQVR
uniref:Uncharacterized protein n=1 Tax=Rangifer tarandus platyrhynchus TaxID=3082113 RepID=A0ACB0FAW9_RANTA|nr:unnamed protein product [Rangifer tarandus platyrhynchus]